MGAGLYLIAGVVSIGSVLVGIIAASLAHNQPFATRLVILVLPVVVVTALVFGSAGDGAAAGIGVLFATVTVLVVLAPVLIGRYLLALRRNKREGWPPKPNL